MKKKMTVSLFIIIFSIATSLNAGGKGQQTGTQQSMAPKQVTLIHYLTETAKLKALQDMAAGFTVESGIHVELESTSMDNFRNIIKLRLSAGDAPDLMQGGPRGYLEFIQSGNMQPITDQEFIKRINPTFSPNMMYEDEFYSVPLDLMANVVFYNKDIFAKNNINIPQTYNEFIEVCNKLKSAGITAAAAGYQDNISLGANVFTILYGANYKDQYFVPGLMSGKKAAEFSNIGRALTQWREIMQYQNNNRKTINTDRAEQLFANGETAMIIIGTWGLGAILDYNPNGNFGGFMYPSEDNPNSNLVPVTTDDTFMSLKSNNFEGAMKFFEYMTRPEVNSMWCGTTAQLSALVGVDVPALPPAAQDIAKYIAEDKMILWTAPGSFGGQQSTAWYNVLKNFAMADNMTVGDFYRDIDAEFSAANK
jgi:ABC-type glycerol-3-phosphate transport system substrate-binding protein